MQAGVQLADPQRIDIRGRVETGSDVFIAVNVVLEGDISLGDGVHIGPGCVLKDCQLAAGTRVQAYSVLEGMRSLGACDIGPFARVRPGTELMEGCKVGNFVEIKKTTVGAGADIGAGSTVSKDAPAGQLTISRAKQVTIRGWKRPVKK